MAPTEPEVEDRAIYFPEPLTFRFGNDAPVLHDIDVTVQRGTRTLLVGSNGAGKSTLLRIFGGMHLTKQPVITLGSNSFHDTRLNFRRVLLDSAWGRRSTAFVGTSAFMTDIKVSEMMVKLQAQFPERKKMLMRILKVNPDWRMHMLSDGQRCRVQIFLGLLRPFELLLLDELTSVLDVVCRTDFYNFLKSETETRGATVVFATHIFDGLDDWFTHVHYVREGRTAVFQPLSECAPFQAYRQAGTPSPLLLTITDWLRDEPANAVEKEDGGHEPSSLDHAGGYTSGRMSTYIFDEEKKARREARLAATAAARDAAATVEAVDGETVSMTVG